MCEMRPGYRKCEQDDNFFFWQNLAPVPRRLKFPESFVDQPTPPDQVGTKSHSSTIKKRLNLVFFQWCRTCPKVAPRSRPRSWGPPAVPKCPVCGKPVYPLDQELPLSSLSLLSSICSASIFLLITLTTCLLQLLLSRCSPPIASRSTKVASIARPEVVLTSWRSEGCTGWTFSMTKACQRSQYKQRTDPTVTCPRSDCTGSTDWWSAPPANRSPTLRSMRPRLTRRPPRTLPWRRWSGKRRRRRRRRSWRRWSKWWWALSKSSRRFQNPVSLIIFVAECHSRQERRFWARSE